MFLWICFSSFLSICCFQQTVLKNGKRSVTVGSTLPVLYEASSRILNQIILITVEVKDEKEWDTWCKCFVCRYSTHTHFSLSLSISPSSLALPNPESENSCPVPLHLNQPLWLRMFTVHAWNSGSMFVSLVCSLAWLLRCVLSFPLPPSPAWSVASMYIFWNLHEMTMVTSFSSNLCSYVVYDVTNGCEFRRKPFKSLSPSMVPNIVSFLSLIPSPLSLTLHNVAYSSVWWLNQNWILMALSFSSFPCRLSLVVFPLSSFHNATIPGKFFHEFRPEMYVPRLILGSSFYDTLHFINLYWRCHISFATHVQCKKLEHFSSPSWCVRFLPIFALDQSILWKAGCLNGKSVMSSIA